MSWLSANWKWVLAISLLILGGIAAVVLTLVFQRRKARELMAKLRLYEAQTAVRALEASRRDRNRRFQLTREEALALEDRIRDAKRRAVSVVRDVRGMSPAAIAEAYRELMKEDPDEVARRAAEGGKE